MTDSSDLSNVEITFGLADPELEDDQSLKFAKKLLPELRQLDEVEKADRTEDVDPEMGAKMGLATIVGLLTSHVNILNLKGFLGWLSDRVPDKPIKIKMKYAGNEVEIEAKSSEELKKAIQSIKELFGEINV
ncbi:hypothetical protein BCD67_23085 [Oscillatoriales cyanobacterium USR001]|nr:hypothetical protein BCD67_23085 [Oscillatoriales cyanobacterium USR001]